MTQLPHQAITMMVSLLGSTAFARATGLPWETSLCWGVGWACASVTLHRLIVVIAKTML